MTVLEAKKAPNIHKEETNICLDYMPGISPEDQPLPSAMCGAHASHKNSRRHQGGAQTKSTSAVTVWYSLVSVEGSKPVGDVQLRSIFVPPLTISLEP